LSISLKQIFGSEKNDAYEQELKRQRDERAVYEQKILEGEARGIAKGKAQGVEEEREKLTEGMLAQNIPDSTICAITGISLEKLEQFKTRLLRNK
jgi:hypothetical protein